MDMPVRSLEHGRAQHYPGVQVGVLGWLGFTLPRGHGMAQSGTCHASVQAAPDLCLLLLPLHRWSKVSCILTSSMEEEAWSPRTSVWGKTGHSRLVGAQAQPGASPISSGLELVSPVKSSEERDRR